MARTMLKQQQATGMILHTEEDPKDIHDQLKGHLNQIHKSWFNVSLLLSEIEEKGKFGEKGCTSMDEYVREELGMEYRTLRYRIQMGKKLRKLGITEDQVEGITEWTRFKEVMPMLTEDMTHEQVNGILTLARENNVEELKAIKQSRKEEGTGRKITKTKISFTLIDDQYQSWNRAEKILRENFDYDIPGQILEALCLFFEAHHRDDKRLMDRIVSESRKEVNEKE